MLESLVTILEPVFHRDFATALRGAEPSSLLGMPRRSTKHVPEQHKDSSRFSLFSSNSSTVTSLLVSSERLEQSQSDRSRLGERPSSKVSLRQERPSDGDTIAFDTDDPDAKAPVSELVTGRPSEKVFGEINLILPSVDASDKLDSFTDNLSVFVEKLVVEAFVEAGKKYTKYKPTQVFDDIDALGNLVPRNVIHEIDALGNLVRRYVPQVTKEDEPMTIDVEDSETRRIRQMKLLQEIAALDAWIPKKSVVETQHHNAWSSYGFQLVPTDVSLPAVHRHHSSFKGQDVRSADFFSARPGRWLLRFSLWLLQEVSRSHIIFMILTSNYASSQYRFP